MSGWGDMRWGDDHWGGGNSLPMPATLPKHRVEAFRKPTRPHVKIDSPGVYRRKK